MIAGDHLEQMGLVEGQLPTKKRRYFAGVGIEANDRVAEFGQTRAGDQANVTRPDNRNASAPIRLLQRHGFDGSKSLRAIWPHTVRAAGDKTKATLC
jgi:hypothetical protein